MHFLQRWSQGHKARGQGQGYQKNPRTDPLEAKDRNAWGQGQGPTTQAQVFSKKRSLKFFFRRSPIEEHKKDLRKVSARFLAFSNKILTVQKIVLSSSRRQGDFRGLEALTPRTWGFEAKAKNFKMCPRGRPWPRPLIFYWHKITWPKEKQKIQINITSHICNDLTCDKARSSSTY